MYMRPSTGVSRLPITVEARAGDGKFGTAVGAKSVPPNEWVAEPYRMQDNANAVPLVFDGLVRPATPRIGTKRQYVDCRS